jgi:pilus assembly protein Flp/PilA
MTVGWSSYSPLSFLRVGRVFAAEDPQIVKAGSPTVFVGRYLQLLHRWGRTVPAMITLIRKFWADETAATAIEYGLIAAGISLAIIAVVNGIGAKLNTKFSSINTSLK